MSEINWIATIFIGAFLSIPFGILTNLLTPFFHKKIEIRALSTKKKKLEILQKEYEETKSLHEDPILFSAQVARSILSGITIILLSISSAMLVAILELMKKPFPGSNSFLFTSQLIILIFYMFATFIAEGAISKIVDVLIRLSKFKEYEEDVRTKIKELKTLQNQKGAAK